MVQEGRVLLYLTYFIYSFFNCTAFDINKILDTDK